MSRSRSGRSRRYRSRVEDGVDNLSVEAEKGGYAMQTELRVHNGRPRTPRSRRAEVFIRAMQRARASIAVSHHTRGKRDRTSHSGCGS